MRYVSLIRPVFVALIVTVLHPPLALAQSCQRKAEITSGADAFTSPPKFVTGLGWQGNHQAYLTRGTQVYICEEKRTEFGLSTKVWAKIAYRDRSGFQFGWVLRENVADWHAWRRDDGSETYFGLIAVVYASDSPLQERQQSEWKLEKLPAETSPKGDSESVALGGNRASTTLDDLFTLYAPLFIAMLFGMIAKATADWLDASDNSVLRQHVRNALTAFLVSPIVFLGFLSAGEFSTSRQTFIVLCLLAFQNGFFWQTVLKKDSPRTELNGVPAVTAQAARSELSKTPR
jgi:hypothetical protein